jgi:uncharacterized protein YhhL (DUF1145 family)
VDLKKAALLVVWLASAACFFIQIESVLVTAGQVLFGSLVTIHAIEWLAFRDLFKGSKNGALDNFSGTILFGFLHIQDVRAEVEGHAQED